MTESLTFGTYFKGGSSLFRVRSKGNFDLWEKLRLQCNKPPPSSHAHASIHLSRKFPCLLSPSAFASVASLSLAGSLACLSMLICWLRRQGHLTVNLQRVGVQGYFVAQCVSNRNTVNGRLKIIKQKPIQVTQSPAASYYTRADLRKIEDYNKRMTNLKTLEQEIASTDMIEACNTVYLLCVARQGQGGQAALAPACLGVAGFGQ